MPAALFSPAWRPMVGIAALCAAAGAAVVPLSAAHAGALTVMPVRVDIAPGREFCSITVRNDAPDNVSVQLRGYRWRQGAEGEDMLDPAPQLIINPSIVTLAPGQRQVVRCSVPADVSVPEETFRILVNELPSTARDAGVLQTLLQISIPVFRSQPQARPQIMWSRRDDGCIALTNVGAAHARLASVQLRTAGSDAERAHQGFYLLAGASRALGPCGPTGDPVIRVEATLGDGSVSTLEQRSAASR